MSFILLMGLEEGEEWVVARGSSPLYVLLLSYVCLGPHVFY